jgi:hypothetical protein
MAGIFLLIIDRSIHRLYCKYARFVSSSIRPVFHVPSTWTIFSQCFYLLPSFSVLICILTYSLFPFDFLPWQATSYNLASIGRYIDSTVCTFDSFHRRFTLYLYLRLIHRIVSLLFFYSLSPSIFLQSIFDHVSRPLTQLIDLTGSHRWCLF